MPFVHRHHERCGCAARAFARPFSLPSTPRRFERDRPFTVRHIALDLSLDVPRKSVDGVAVLHLERVDATAKEVVLDAVGFTIRSVEISVADADFSVVAHRYDGDSLTIPVDATHARIRVTYRVTPRRGLYFLAPDEHVTDRPEQVWTQCQDEDARFWIPCHDKPHQKCTTEMRVSVPAAWYALSNGALVSREVVNDRAIFHWKMAKPHSSYLITLVAGDFAQLNGGEVDSVPITFLVPKGREDDGTRTFAETAAMVRHFATLTGVPFPWEKYAQVVVSDFIFGGMENTTATTMYEHILVDARAALDVSSEPLIAHELAHQWFGDLVTCRDWSHGWLNEGFATFFESLDRERRGGLDEYHYGLLGDQEGYLGEASGRYKRPIVCQDYENPIELFDAHLYEKGELVLHMLRVELGDEVFWKGVHLYLERHAFKIVETRDLMRALEEVSGRSLERFFDQWVMKPGHPELDVRIEIETNLVVVHVSQTQKQSEVALFTFDLELDLHVDGEGERRETVKVERARHTFAFRTSARANHVVVDPRHRVVGEVRVEGPADAFRHQLKNAPTARGRWLAAQAMTRRDDPASIQALAATVRDTDAFWGTRVESAQSLGAIRSDDSMNALRELVTVEHPKVRRAVVGALGRFRKRESADTLRPLALRDPSYLVEAEAARSLGSTRQAAAFDTLVEVLDRPSWSDVIRVGAADGLAALRDDRAVPHLLARVRYGIPMRARRAAIRSLSRLTSDRRARESLEDLLEDQDPLVRSDVVSSLGEMNDSKSRGPLQRALDHETDGRVARRIRDVLRDLGSSSARAEQQRLSDELETLKNELGELRSRLSRIEAK